MLKARSSAVLLILQLVGLLGFIKSLPNYFSCSVCHSYVAVQLVIAVLEAV